MFSGVLTIFRAYFSVCTFRLGPQDLPAAVVFLIISLILYGLASVALVLPVRAAATAVLAGAAETGLLLLLTWGLLWLRGLPARFRQTATALAGTGFLFSMAALPLFSLRYAYDGNAAVILAVGLLVLALVIWNVAVMAHILRHAMSVSFAMGVLLAMGYIWVITTVMALLTPESAV
jgi:hypothetical protein